MRRFALIVMAASLAAPQARAVQLQCLTPEERTAFDLQALRSEMMVLATGCSDDQQYNAFMKKFQAAVAANAHQIDEWFKRKYGKRAQAEYDRFITDLANGRSMTGMRLGTDFCPRNTQVFQEALALRNPDELGPFAAGQDLIPSTAQICPETPAPAVKKAAAPAKKKK